MSRFCRLPQSQERRGQRKNQVEKYCGSEMKVPTTAAGYFHTLTLVQLVLLHDAVLQLGAHFLLLLLERGGLPAVFLINLASNPESTSAPSGSSVRVNVVAQDGGLDELGGGVRRWLASWTHKAPVFQVGAVEGLHLVDLVGQVYVSIDS